MEIINRGGRITRLGLREAERIAFLNYRVGVYGTKKGNVEGGEV